MCSEEAVEEIEALAAILEEGTVAIVSEGDDNRELNVCLTPLTASEQDKQYVSLTLVIKISADYPSLPPELSVKNPRGLDESAVSSLLQQMNLRCEEYIGCPVLYELIEFGREFLTQRNVPVCQCIICLNNIQEEDVFMKTECLHFFHKHCLGRYITSMQKDYELERKESESENKHSTQKEFMVTCPVCRERIEETKYNLPDLLSAPQPIAGAGELTIKIGDDIKKLQTEMKRLFLKQKERGGIIDLEEEGRKYLVLTGTQSSSEEFTELSPTDFSADERNPLVRSPQHRVSTPKSQTPKESPVHDYTYFHGDRSGGRGRGRSRGDQRGGNHSKPVQEQVTSKGKSHHQQRKGKGKLDRGESKAKGDRRERREQL